MKTSVAKCIARANSPHRQPLLPIVPNRPNPSNIIIISDNSVDKSEPNDFNLRLEFNDHLVAINSNNKIDH